MFFLNVDDQEAEHGIRALLTSFFPGCEIGYDDSEDAKLHISLKNGILSIENKCFDVGSDMKNAVVENTYAYLKNMTGRDLPWGNLTGVRPSKIPYAMISGNKTKDECISYLMNERHVSRDKASLAYEVADKEYALLDGKTYNDHYSLYVGIPFCPSRCLYCSFTSFPLERYRGMVDEYLDCLCRELKATAEIMSGRFLDTIYIGGGTPTTLKPHQLDRLLGFIENTFDLSRLKEFSLEAGRPDSITEDKLKVISDHRVDRISINPQTMKDETLALIGRKHSVKDILETYSLAESLGFKNINMDLIAGLPGENIDDFRYSLEECIKLGPSDITIHCLSLKRAARLNIMKDKYKELSFTGIDEAVDYGYKRLKEASYLPYYMYRQRNQAGNYENVGYSVTGSECLYNILIMEEVQTIVACGAGAAGKVVFEGADRNRIERVENVKDVISYIQRTDEMIERKRQALWSN